VKSMPWRLLIGVLMVLALTVAATTGVAAKRADEVRWPGEIAFKGDTVPGVVPIRSSRSGDVSVDHWTPGGPSLYMHYDCDIWFVYVWEVTNNSYVEGWAWTEAHTNSLYSSPLVEVNSIYANQRLWRDSTLIDSDLHLARTNASADTAEVYRGGCSISDPIFFYFHSTSYHQISDELGSAYATDSDGF